MDITLEMVRRNSQLPDRNILKDFLLTPPSSPFPVSSYQRVQQYNLDGMFSCGSSDRHCVRLSEQLLRVLNPPLHGKDEFAYIPLWNVILNDTLSIFMLQAFEFSRKTNQETQLPDYVGYVATFFALWRGEEKGPSTDGDPRRELVDKLVWVYRTLPYLMAYYARGLHVTVTALACRNAVVEAVDLLSVNVDLPEDRIRSMLIMFNLSRILTKLAETCKEAKNGKSVTLKGYDVVKGYSDFDKAVRVFDIYQLLKDIPNAEKCKTVDRPRKRKRLETSLVMVPRCSQEARVRPTQRLVTALLHVTNALYHAHKKVKLMHRDVTWRNVGLDESCNQFILFDWDEACKSPCKVPHPLCSVAHAPEMMSGRHTSPCKVPHPLCSVAHAPEMMSGRHTTAVDVWGIGHFVSTATGVEKPQELVDLASECLEVDPRQRPTIDECLARLQTMHRSICGASSEEPSR